MNPIESTNHGESYGSKRLLRRPTFGGGLLRIERGKLLENTSGGGQEDGYLISICDLQGREIRILDRKNTCKISKNT